MFIWAVSCRVQPQLFSNICFLHKFFTIQSQNLFEQSKKNSVICTNISYRMNNKQSIFRSFSKNLRIICFNTVIIYYRNLGEKIQYLLLWYWAIFFLEITQYQGNYLFFGINCNPTSHSYGIVCDQNFWITIFCIKISIDLV